MATSHRTDTFTADEVCAMLEDEYLDEIASEMDVHV